MDALAIRLLATTNNERGNLFTRLMGDLFFSLGYDDLHFDTHKAGREIDIQGKHRYEPRTVIAECKAHASKMGGSKLNKFLGILTRERKSCEPVSVSGYFVSLSGFTETGIEQEKETGEGGLILLDAARVIQELEKSHVLVGRTEAAERAGQCAHHSRLTGAALEGVELLGHARGYIWAVFYSRGKETTHFALIHADGTPLAENVAKEVINADRKCSGSLHSIHYLAPEPTPPERADLASKAEACYRNWLAEECGFIQLDGLPADADLSATRLKLERLFVPLKAYYLPEPNDKRGKKESREIKILKIGDMLTENVHLALLASPGGGKSTLLKRLAIAYAFPERRPEVSDDLPERDWLPLFLRCRELRDRAHRPILEILDDLPRNAGMNKEEAQAFCESIHDALRAGRILLLVDGLDEISDEGARQVFTKHLRTFLAVFPKSAIAVSSREAGFRLVAGVVASAFRKARLAPFDKNDVQHLCERWHIQVIGDKEKVRSDARELASTIWENARIRTLAENPLLLTTLLIVKRWIGELPRNRAALYREAIRVLIRTWNVEGYTPLDEDETLAQLSFVACAMMEQGTQRIGQLALIKLLQKARQELEAELHFVEVSENAFIERIEYRSSLLIQTGHDMMDNELQPVYEFRHLTFQEYLAARGYVEEQYPGRAQNHTLLDLLEPHFRDESWREVVVLSAVLAGRKAEDLIKCLTTICADTEYWSKYRDEEEDTQPIELVRQCLLDEVQVTRSTLHAALAQAARHCSYACSRQGNKILVYHSNVAGLRQGKYGVLIQQLIEECYLNGKDNWHEYAIALTDQALEEYGFRSSNMPTKKCVAESLLKAIETGNRKKKVCAAFVCTAFAFWCTSNFYSDIPSEHAKPDQHFQPLCDALCQILIPDDQPIAFAACQALADIGYYRLCIDPIPKSSMLCLYDMWRDSPSMELSRTAAEALAAQPLLPRNAFKEDDWGTCDSFLRKSIKGSKKWPGKESARAAILVAWYRKAPWGDEELIDLIKKLPHHTYTSYELLGNLGDKGKATLESLRKEYTERKRR